MWGVVATNGTDILMVWKILSARQQQLAYVEEAHKREQPPLEAIAAPEILRGELCRAQICTSLHQRARARLESFSTH